MTTKDVSPSFKTVDEAHRWAMVHGRDNCRPCDEWKIIVVDEAYKVGVFYRSGQLICYAE